MRQPKQMQFTYGGKSYAYELYLGGVKRINLRVRPDGTIRVSAPYLTSGHRIEAFLVECGDRIAAAVERAQGRSLPQAPTMTPEEKAERKERLLALLHERHRNFVLPRFAAVLPLLTERQRQYIEAPSAVRVRDMSSRWGSCNAQKGTLNFNLRLLDHPIECIEYVLIHEFAHFVHPDHSPAFHELVSRLLPDWRERKKRLNGQ